MVVLVSLLRLAARVLGEAGPLVVLKTLDLAVAVVGIRESAEVVVFVCGDDVAALVDVLRHVAVVVVGGKVEAAVGRNGEKPSDASGALKRL